MMKRSVQTWEGAFIVWIISTIIEALAYQTYRLLIIGSFDTSWFLSVFSRYLLFRVIYSLIPILVGIALIHASKLSTGWAYLVVALMNLIAPLYFSMLSETVHFDPSIIGFSLGSILLLYVLRFRRDSPAAADL